MLPFLTFKTFKLFNRSPSIFLRAVSIVERSNGAPFNSLSPLSRFKQFNHCEEPALSAVEGFKTF